MSNKDLMSMLNQARETLKSSQMNTVEDARPKEKIASQKKVTAYDRYRARLEKGDIESFKSGEVLYFFYDLLKEHHKNRKYFIGNLPREKHQIKIAIERYGVVKVMEMVEYLLTSNQKLLKIGTFSPSILSTKWGNTISVLTDEWINDSSDAPSESSREWGKVDTSEYRVSIGEWGDE